MKYAVYFDNAKDSIISHDNQQAEVYIFLKAIGPEHK